MNKYKENKDEIKQNLRKKNNHKNLEQQKKTKKN